MKKRLLTVAIASMLFATAPVFAAASDWLVRLRALDIAPDTSSSALNLDASNEWVPELDFSYFATDHLALELILATNRHTISANGADVGKVTLLPPTLTLQYHFMPAETFRPYVGAGVNYTRFYDVNLGGGTLTVDNDSWGGALQAGFDYGIDKDWFVNLDVKKIWISTDVKVAATGATAASFDINPWVFGVGIGRKF
ncbi:MAG TPA: OmpW family outer membrane protein [Burkholderiales bacterium]|nr:OmpW family outer membrane protein [Burkholderiales bacterium]